MFSEKICQELKSYVYLLINPESQEPFYVWKWTNNRVFEHVECSLKDWEIKNNKYDEIRKITRRWKKVEYIIVRHWLTSQVAEEIEATLIDIFNYFKKFNNFNLWNIQWGVHSLENWLMTLEEIQNKYDAKPLNEIWEDCVIININRNYIRGSSQNSIFNATKWIWRIWKNRTESLNYVLSEYRWLIVEVFEVEKWYPEERWYNIWSKKYGEKYVWYSFTGQIAKEKIRDKYIWKSVIHLKKRGFAGTLIYSSTLQKLQS